MLQRLIRSLGLVLLFGVVTCAQTSRAVGSATASIEDRAQQLEPFIAASAVRYGLDAHLLRILCFMESRFRVDAISPKGARGPMQLMPDTARRYGALNPHDPQQAIDAAARYLRDLLNRFGGRVELAMAAYNAGEGAVESFRTGRPLLLPTGKLINPHRLITGGIPPYPETREYVRQGLSLLQRDVAPKALPVNAATPIPRAGATRDFTLDTFVVSEVIPGKSHLHITSFIDVP